MTTTSLRRTVVSAVLIVALVAAIVSYLHIQHLAVRSGQSMLASVLLPFSIDGTVAAASMVMFGAARRGEKPPRLARGMLGLSIAATLAANVAEGMSHGIVGAAVSGWPAVAFAGAVEMFMWDVRRGAATPVRAPVARRARPAAPVQAPVAPHPEPVTPDSGPVAELPPKQSDAIRLAIEQTGSQRKPGMEKSQEVDVIAAWLADRGQQPERQRIYDVMRRDQGRNLALANGKAG